MPIIESGNECAAQTTKYLIFQRFFTETPNRLRSPREEGVGKEEKLFRAVR
jgi:hypothetical protein